MLHKNRLSAVIALALGMGGVSPAVVVADHKDKDAAGYVLTGNCAEVVADRTTEFHGNPVTSGLNLAMAGNQWVVFNVVMQAYNERRAAKEKNVDLTAIGNQPRTLKGYAARVPTILSS